LRSQRRKGKRRSSRAVVLLGLGILLMVGAVVIWVLADPPDRGGQASIPASAAEVERVSVGEARAALDEQRAVFLDVRVASDYERSRIPGAVSIPLGELEQRYAELDPQDWIITYCT
jgi:hypothetical protein